jgi:aminoglycoside phosphotransferase (APT) family kinase protein
MPSSRPSLVRAQATGVDAAALTRWFDSLSLGTGEQLTVSLIGKGGSNITCAVSDSSGGRWVVRRPPLGTLLDSAHDIAREYRVLVAMRDTPVPVPRAIALTTDPAYTDAPLMLMNHVDGLVVEDADVAASLPPAMRRAVGLGMVDALASVHAVDLEQVGLADLASRRPIAARQLKRWSKQWEASRTREQPVVAELAERLGRAMPAEREVVLIHGDYHLVNVMIDREDGHTRAIFDWELCTLGDPLADLGLALAYWPDPGDPAGGIVPGSAVPGFPSRDEVLDAYARITGRDVSGIGFWHALALWKLAIIMEGMRRRGLDDPSNAERGVMCDVETIDGVLEEAVAQAAAAGI